MKTYKMTPQEAVSVRDRARELEKDIVTCKSLKSNPLYKERDRSFKITFGRELAEKERELAALEEYLKGAPPEPVNPQDALAQMVRPLQDDVDKYNEEHKKFVEKLSKFPIDTIEWRAESLVEAAWKAKRAKAILEACDTFEDFVLIYRENYKHLTEDQLDYSPTHSTSAFDRAVDDAIATARRSVIRWEGYRLKELEYLEEAVWVWNELNKGGGQDGVSAD